MIKGILCDGKTSCHKQVELVCDSSGMLHFQGADFEPVCLKSIHISPRLANTSRFIQLPDGSQFETQNNDAVDFLARKKGGGSTKAARIIYTLETYKTWVLTAFIVLIVGAGVFVKYGTPFISNEIAMTLPMEASIYIGDNMEESLEEYWESTTLLEQERQQQLQQLFTYLLPASSEEIPWQVSFREGGFMGANAFALPNGTIIFTDELISLADNDQQLASIMLHEIGVQHRHGLRTLIQDFTLALLFMAVSGDVSSSSAIITALPAMLLESGYSQDMEWEADTYALEEMLKRNLNPASFAEIMIKMENQLENIEKNQAPQSCGSDEVSDEEADTDLAENEYSRDKQPQEQAKVDTPIWQYFSTHPATEERIERFLEAAKYGTSEVGWAEE